MSSKLTDYASKVFASGVRFLGQVVWLSVPDLRITPAQVQAIGAKHGLRDLPDLGHPSDAFRRATTAQAHRGEAKTTRYLMRPVLDKDGVIIRHIVIERVDTKGKKLGHVGVYELRYEKAADKMVTQAIGAEFNNLSATEQAVVAKMVQDAIAEFQDFRSSLTGHEVQRWVMRQLRALSQIPVHPNGGVYFVPAPGQATVAKLNDFVKALTPHIKTSSESLVFNAVPIPDVPDQRAMVTTGAVEAIKNEAASLVAEIAEQLSKVSCPAMDSVVGQISLVRAVREKRDAYSALLNDNLSALEETLKLLDTQSEALLQRASRRSDHLIDTLRTLPSVEVQVNEGTVTVSRKNSRTGYRLTAHANDDGWTLSGSKDRAPILERGLRDRSEYKETRGGKGWSVRTDRADVALLFVADALRIQVA